MRAAVMGTETSVRPLRSTDLERVIAIDSSHVGEVTAAFL